MHFVPRGDPDPRLTPEPDDVPPGVSGILSSWHAVSIDGGPVSVTISIPKGREDDVRTAIAEKNIAKLQRVDREFVPFWCYVCDKSYCREHWTTRTIFDEGFFDYIEGVCLNGHRQMLCD